MPFKWLKLWLLCIFLLITHLTQPAWAIEEVQPMTAANEYTTDDPKLPSEVQKAVCTVLAGEVKASAEAVTTKTLKGVCGSDEMNLAFRKLEVKLLQELAEVKQMLLQLAAMQGYALPAAAPSSTSSTAITPTEQALYTTIATPLAATTSKQMAVLFEPLPELKTSAKKTPKLKLLEIERTQVAREQEVNKFNNTLLADRDFKLFTYYWKVDNFTQHIANATTTTVESPIFSIRGKSLQLKCTFQHLQRDMIFLQLGYASAASGSQHNIMLDMGGIFKQLKLTSDVNFRHKLSILDQHSRRTQDLSSQELLKLETGFSIPNSALLGSTYIKNNTLLVQIILYL